MRNIVKNSKPAIIQRPCSASVALFQQIQQQLRAASAHVAGALAGDPVAAAGNLPAIARLVRHTKSNKARLNGGLESDPLSAEQQVPSSIGPAAAYESSLRNTQEVP